MDTTAAVDFIRESPRLDDFEGAISEPVGFERWRILALGAFGTVSAFGLAYALVKSFAEARAGSAAEATERILRRPEEPSLVGVAIVIVLIVALAVTAAAVALHRHAD